MKLRGKLVDIVRDLLTGVFRITFEVRTIPSGIDALRDADLALSLSKWRDKRSLTANAYYWVLVTKIADATGLPNAKVHNMLLRRYGVPELMDGDLMTVMVPNDQDEEILMKEIYHLKPTSHTKAGKDGKVFRAYILMKGSSDFDTKEMATLLEGTIQEAKDLGIETLPPDEIERMMEAYEKHSTNR